MDFPNKTVIDSVGDKYSKVPFQFWFPLEKNWNVINFTKYEYLVDDQLGNDRVIAWVFHEHEDAHYQMKFLEGTKVSACPDCGVPYTGDLDEVLEQLYKFAGLMRL